MSKNRKLWRLNLFLTLMVVIFLSFSFLPLVHAQNDNNFGGGDGYAFADVSNGNYYADISVNAYFVQGSQGLGINLTVYVTNTYTYGSGSYFLITILNNSIPGIDLGSYTPGWTTISHFLAGAQVVDQEVQEPIGFMSIK